jgi:hypothetical protein
MSPLYRLIKHLSDETGRSIDIVINQVKYYSTFNSFGVWTKEAFDALRDNPELLDTLYSLRGLSLSRRQLEMLWLSPQLNLQDSQGC